MYENINTFGRFVREKRLDAGDVMLKDIGYAVGVSLSYLSDIEHDRRNPGEGFNYEALAKLLRLTEDEKAHMYDLAGKCRKTVPEDIEEVMMNTESGKKAAEQRDAFMRTFLNEFFAEWDGGSGSQVLKS